MNSVKKRELPEDTDVSALLLMDKNEEDSKWKINLPK